MTYEWKLRVHLSPYHDGHGGVEEHTFTGRRPSERTITAAGGKRPGRRIELYRREVSDWELVAKDKCPRCDGEGRYYAPPIERVGMCPDCDGTGLAPV